MKNFYNDKKLGDWSPYNIDIPSLIIGMRADVVFMHGLLIDLSEEIISHDLFKSNMTKSLDRLFSRISIISLDKETLDRLIRDRYKCLQSNIKLYAQLKELRDKHTALEMSFEKLEIKFENLQAISQKTRNNVKIEWLSYLSIEDRKTFDKLRQHAFANKSYEKKKDKKR